jgi:hypothetical protein
VADSFKTFAVPFIAKRFGEQTNVFCGDDCPRAVLRADSSGDAGIAAATASLRHLQRGTTAVLLFWQSRKKAGVANANQRLRHLTNHQLHLVVLLPLRDDWTSAAELIRRLDRAISSIAYRIEIVLVDDASVQGCERCLFPSSLSAVRTIQILRLRCNLGHQRAIAIGLMHIKQTTTCDAVVVMDADGEDTPEGLIQLIDAYSKHSSAVAIFAERTRRMESLLFRSSYIAYKTLHRILTGISVRVGNFSILPFQPAFTG